MPQIAPPQPRSPAPIPSFRCFTITVFFLFITVLALIGLLIWLSYLPRKVRYSIEHGSITHFNLTNSTLNASFHFSLRAADTGLTLYYDKIDVILSYEDTELSTNNVHPFYQGRRYITEELNLEVKYASVYGRTARDLKREMEGGVVRLDVKIRAEIRTEIWLKRRFFKIHKKLKVDCESVAVPLDERKGFERVWCNSHMHG